MKKRLVCLCLLTFALALVAALAVGRYPIGLGDLLRIAASLLPGTGPPAVAPEVQAVFWNIRVPRILLSIAVGSGLSIAGVVFQALFRNPLAAPDILGVTAGSSFGAALAIMFLTRFVLGIQGLAFVFGVLAVSIAYFLANRSWDRSTSVLVISGIVVSAVFQAGVSILMYLADPYDQLSKIVFLDHGQLSRRLLGQGAGDPARGGRGLPAAVGIRLAPQRHDPRRGRSPLPRRGRLSLATVLSRHQHPGRRLVGGGGRQHQLDRPDSSPHRPLSGRHRTSSSHPDRGVHRRRVSAGHGYRGADGIGVRNTYQHHYLDPGSPLSRLPGDSIAAETEFRMSVRVDDLTAGYGNTLVLHGVSVGMATGRICALIGRNGSGKTTLMRCINGILKPVTGSISVSDRDLRQMKRDEIARRISLVPQGNYMPFQFSCLEIVLMGCAARIKPWSAPCVKEKQRAMEICREVGVADLAKRPFNSLSGGQKQLVMLARALHQDAPVMLLDEPNSHLDFPNQHMMMNLMRRFVSERGVTALITLHDPNLALQYCDDVVMLREGRVVASGPTTEILDDVHLREVLGGGIVMERTESGGRVVVPRFI